MKKLIQKVKDTSFVSKIDWLLFAIISSILFACFIYADMLYTVSHANNMLTALLSGHFLGAYEINYNFPVDGILSMVCYDLPIYAIFIVWNFPLWLIQKFFSVDIINSFLCLLWMKGLLVVFLFGCSIVLKNILKYLKVKDNLIKWAILIFVSSPLVFSSLFILSQYDIIPLFFMLLGVYAYMKKDYKKFLLWFAIAIPFKIFAIFAFIPLVLLKEKKILKILLNLFVGSAILIFSKILSSFMPYYAESTSVFNDGMLGKLLSTSQLPINLGLASLFIIAYLFLCIYCYVKELKSDEEINKFSTYIPFASFSLLFLLIAYHPYWLIYTTPFFAILIFQNSKHFKTNLLLDISMSISSLLSQVLVFSWCFGAKQVNNMLLPHLFGFKDLSMVKYSSIKDILELFKVSTFMPFILALYFVSVVSVLIINRPTGEKQIEDIKIERSVIWSRILIIAPFAALMIFCYYS